MATGSHDPHYITDNIQVLHTMQTSANQQLTILMVVSNLLMKLHKTLQEGSDTGTGIGMEY